MADKTVGPSELRSLHTIFDRGMEKVRDRNNRKYIGALRSLNSERSNDLRPECRSLPWRNRTTPCLAHQDDE